MHELSIAESIMRIVVANATGRRVTRVALKVGHLRQVVPSALAFAFELVAEGTPAEGAALEIEDVAAVARCGDCGAETRLEAPPFHCADCGGFDLEWVQGEELLVEWLEVEEAGKEAG